MFVPTGRSAHPGRRSPEASPEVATLDPIPLVHASLGKQELAAVEEVFASEWTAGQGPRGKALETELAERYGVADAVTLSSCAAALHLALLALGVGPGDEVIVADYTFPEIGRASCRERVLMPV